MVSFQFGLKNLDNFSTKLRRKWAKLGVQRGVETPRRRKVLACVACALFSRKNYEVSWKPWQRDWATPVPRVQDRAELNAHLRACCLRDRERVQARRTETSGRRFAREHDNALSLPPFH
jgi:type II secretory pathway component PulM